jgi:hypothetical protein
MGSTGFIPSVLRWDPNNTEPASNAAAQTSASAGAKAQLYRSHSRSVTGDSRVMLSRWEELDRLEVKNTGCCCVVLDDERRVMLMGGHEKGASVLAHGVELIDVIKQKRKPMPRMHANRSYAAAVLVPVD